MTLTLNRPQIMNSLNFDLLRTLRDHIEAVRFKTDVRVVIFTGTGEKAFCAGGDIAEMYATGTAGDFAYGRRFWRDEYRMNARLFEFPKPVASFLQGFTMGGGVGIGCHGSHRVVCESSRIAMPECGIGLIPDVGGSLILGRAPGRLGEYLGTTGTRMGPQDAILAGFADYYIPEETWPGLIAALEETGDWSRIDAASETPPDGKLSALREQIDIHFAGETLGDILRSLHGDEGDFARETLGALERNSPLAMACAVEMAHRLGEASTIRQALALEYRFTHRAMEHSDFLEGIRAAIIDKDRNPKWRHALEEVNSIMVSQMLLPLGADALTFENEQVGDDMP